MTFLLTGFAWLLLSALLAIATLIGMVKGTPLPSWWKTIHVHGALVGGLLQLVIGGFFLSLARSSELKDAYSESRPRLFLTLNVAAVALLVGFWLGQMMLVGLAGLVLIGVVLSLLQTLWPHVQEDLNRPAGAGWIYRAALIALLIGLAIGVAMAFRLFQTYYGHARLLHIHLIVLGFLTVTFVVALHQLIPAVVQKELANLQVARLAIWSLPIGFAVLLAGFVTSSVSFEIAVGSVLLLGVGICTFNLIITWVRSGLPGNAASDHLLIGVFFLLLATFTGLAMGANYLQNPPFLPIGSLHLVAYTHLAFIGFMVQSTCGALSYSLPIVLALSRVPNSKKREPYRAQLEAIMNRWRTVQLGAMSFGTMGLLVLATLTWSVSLGSLYVQGAVWITAGLLLLSLALFAAKLAWAVGLQPTQQSLTDT
ncbi:MAG TPA: hypothetical protein VF732_05960 [Nitrospira sp.]